MVRLIESIVLDTFKDYDFTKHICPIITIYDNPKDYPGKVAARLFDFNRHTPYIVVKDNLMQIRAIIPNFMSKQKRHKGDDPVIVEVYL